MKLYFVRHGRTLSSGTKKVVFKVLAVILLFFLNPLKP